MKKNQYKKIYLDLFVPKDQMRYSFSTKDSIEHEWILVDIHIKMDGSECQSKRVFHTPVECMQR